ncbi:M23 family metallopeptidase [Sphingomonas mucosissima]|uniref:Murein DD-endopeptidase MepM n=1 Tax=Sphingomonas mucosissima TaxID=370959 RepID=A0A245ZML0_9SPHN|nr:M23 family metallopeptidase [Sphingomonas mucosissima]OWK30973.1 murein DD-endopeptidase MepM [Sphingomonas mucosissima]
MYDRNDPEPSFDPRSWGTAPPAAPATAAPMSSPTKVSKPRTLPTGVALAIAAAGAIAAYTARAPQQPQPTPTATASPAQAIDQRTLNVPGPASIAASLTALGVTQTDADTAGTLAIEELADTTGPLRLEVSIAHTRLHALTATHADGGGVVIERDANGTLAAKSLSAKLTRRLTFIRGELDGESFYSSAVAAGVQDVLVGAFANAFRYDFDMQREVSAGDVFEAGFEERVNADGEPVGPATLVYAYLATPAKTRALYRYQLPGAPEAEWFDSSGRSSRRSLMRTPVEAARVSSGFGMRGHPILGFRKMHRGTDFAAPTGTPIFAAGDATVTFAGMKGANGNFVRLHHANGWDTLYLHMNAIMPGISPGTQIAQGTQIGEVGTTGRSTGPHLHYEIHVDGEPVDPLSIETAGGQAIPGGQMAAFRTARDAIDARRAEPR